MPSRDQTLKLRFSSGVYPIWASWRSSLSSSLAPPLVLVSSAGAMAMELKEEEGYSLGSLELDVVGESCVIEVWALAPGAAGEGDGGCCIMSVGGLK